MTLNTLLERLTSGQGQQNYFWKCVKEYVQFFKNIFFCHGHQQFPQQQDIGTQVTHAISHSAVIQLVINIFIVVYAML